MKEEKIKISLNSEVTNLLTDKNKVTGIEVNNSKEFFADKIIVNGDPAFTYKNLLKSNYNKKWNSKRLKRLDYSMGLFYTSEQKEIYQHFTSFDLDGKKV